MNIIRCPGTPVKKITFEKPIDFPAKESIIIIVQRIKNKKENKKMKCAAELIMMKNEAIEAHTAAVNAKYEEMTANAINLCETTINDEFVKKAKNRETLKVKYWIGTYRDDLGHEFFRFGTRRSHSDTTKPAYAVRPFMDYLHKFCYEVVASEVDKDGDRELTIYIPKEDSNRTCGV